MNVGFVIYNNMTALDFIGAYDPVIRLRTMGFIPDLRWEICAHTETVQDSAGLGFIPTRIQSSLEAFDLVVVPGGITSLVDDLTRNAAFITWLKTAQSSGLKASVCTGSLLLGAAGFLHGKSATTHPNAFRLLGEFCAQVVVDQRIVDQGDVITARGVTASIDLGLYLCEKLTDFETREKIRLQMDYQTDKDKRYSSY